MNQDKQNFQISRLASVGQIAAGIAHEVRNPLTAVKGFLQLLQEQAPHTYLDIAQSELDNAIVTLQNLLNVAKPDMDEEPFEKIKICTEIESILNLFQDQTYRVTIIKDFKQTETELFAKKNQIKKALFNLLKNSFEAIPDKGEIRISQYCSDTTVYIIISDTGIGIPEEKLIMLGTPFFTTKTDGTGMGLAQVFSTIYQHGGTIEVQSEKDQGTTFTIQLPLELAKEKRVKQLNLQYSEDQTLQEFLLINKEQFEQHLLAEAYHLKDLLSEVKRIGSIDLLNNAHKLVHMLIENKDYDIINFGKQEGQIWAKHSTLNLAIKLEWFQAIRKVLWDFLYNFDRLNQVHNKPEDFYQLERQINTTLDIFLRHFFMSYTEYKDQLLKGQRDMIADLSVPIIPLSSTISIVPLMGTIDNDRANTIQQKVLEQIGTARIKTLIIDMSGVAYLDEEIVQHLFKIIKGITWMGCTPFITGIRPEIANTMVNLGIEFNQQTRTVGTLQQALEELGFKVNGNV
ncbi:ATP-binding protein [Brevibacillus fulvus]|uniref:histidine kinase n=1 Tax=Brevibacillus fulvus TaxID=1125967 RepID=A0A938XTD5_9BACL|nr:ATP-binding protein [Brevibacillus fulvus]MBM7589717.1 rsbT co-antagonist protein RsbR [Brevibacillus fulvus]